MKFGFLFILKQEREVLDGQFMDVPLQMKSK